MGLINSILTWVMKLWRADLTIPFGYAIEGDAFLYCLLTAVCNGPAL